jgi:pimeloyl-ACP methyl ester carboxylesterase
VSRRATIRTLTLGLTMILVGAVLSAAEGVRIESKTADVDGLKIHYLAAGHGDALILLHGYAETSRMWRPVIPLFAERFTVIAPDLPGIGESGIPTDGLSMKKSAASIHALAKSLGIAKARVVGHDIGLMVSYAYATMYPSEVEKLVLLDAFVPGVSGWEDVYNSPAIWHFRFYGPTPEKLVAGRERTYFERFWNDFAADETHSIPEAERVAYTAAYSKPGRMRAGFAYFESFPQTAKDFADLSKTKLTMPILSVGGEKANGGTLAKQMPLIGTNTRSITIPGAGHWILEEKPKETVEALKGFL